MIVVDASVVAVALLDDLGAGDRARAAIASDDLVAPHLLDCEVASVLRRARLRENVSADRVRQALGDLTDLPVMRVSHTPLLESIWELHPTVTSYDAAYVALAEALGAPLLTADWRLAGASGPTCEFKIFS